MQRKAYLILFLVFALVLSGWTVSPALSASTQAEPEQKPSDCKAGTDALVGSLATMPRVTNRARQICDFEIRMNELNSKVSDADRRFIAASIAGNMLEIQSLNYALGQVQNEEWRGLIQMMIAQHTEDLNMAIKIGKKLGVDTTPNLTNVRVYPGTPEYDLGMRRVNLVAKFLDPLMSAGTVITPTITAMPTDMSSTPTTGVTDVPTMTATMGTTTPLATSTGTAMGTVTAGTATPSVTSTMGTASPSATAMVDLTGTATGIATVGTTSPSATSTLGVTSTVTAMSPAVTDTPTAVPTLMTPIPTIPGGPTANFDLVSLMIIEDEHVMSIETALAAERLVQNDEIRAFAKHAADMAKLHLLLINDLQYRMLGLMTLPPPPEFQKDYQGPRRFGPGPDGDD